MSRIPEPETTPDGPAYEGRLLDRVDEEVVDQGVSFDVRTLLSRRTVLGLIGIDAGSLRPIGDRPSQLVGSYEFELESLLALKEGREVFRPAGPRPAVAVELVPAMFGSAPPEAFDVGPRSCVECEMAETWQPPVVLTSSWSYFEDEIGGVKLPALSVGPFLERFVPKFTQEPSP